MIKFIQKDEGGKEELTFAMVKEDRFFIDFHGYLCMKIDISSYTTIANNDNNPYCYYFTCNGDMKIKKILPEIDKIIWDEE